MYSITPLNKHTIYKVNSLYVKPRRNKLQNIVSLNNYFVQKIQAHLLIFEYILQEIYIMPFLLYDMDIVIDKYHKDFILFYSELLLILLLKLTKKQKSMLSQYNINSFFNS